jgi:tRNA threonylcarbamoyladenosine biosynthesis protein TsaB
MSTEPFILGVDTATLGGSVCLTRGKDIVASIIGDPSISHSNTLLRDINRLLNTARVTLSDVELFAAAAGPGSFTGLRIGLATVKAFSMTLSRPCAGIPTLHAIAHSGGSSNVVVAAQPAGRGEVFAQLLSVSSDGVVTELDTPSHVSPKAMIEKYGALTNLKWAGEGARLYQDRIRDAAHERTIEFRDEPANSAGDGRGWVLAGREVNLAKEIAALALQRLECGAAGAPDSLRAIYVRPSDAELKEQCQ